MEGARAGRNIGNGVRARAPSTMLRMVPLPRFAGEEFPAAAFASVLRRGLTRITSGASKRRAGPRVEPS